MTQSEKTTSRRQFLRWAAGGLAAAAAASCGSPEPPATKPCPEPAPTPPVPPAAEPVVAPVKSSPVPEGLDPEHFVLHGSSPLTLEAKRGAIGMGVLTPLSRFFIRNNLPMPAQSIVLDADAWELEVAGVAKPGKITVGQLKRMPAQTVATVVQCSGNGRKFSKHGPSGSQWATGAAGCAMWTGVSVADLVASMGGAAKDAVFMTSTGGDPLPEGIDPLKVMVERSIPADKGLKDCLLAWEMNGAPLPLTHGGPLRLIVPGYYGCNQIKYIKRLAFGTQQTQAKIQRSGYRMRPIGQKGSPDQPSMWRMNVKSWINGPGADDEPVLKGKTRFYGVALSGERGIAKVEYSQDGKTWQEAQVFGPDMGQDAWRTFAFEAELGVGEHTFFTRATDTKGEVQPEARVENERGYGNNSWRDHGLKVKVVEKLPPKKIKAAKTGATATNVGKAKQVDLSPQGKRGRELLLKKAEPGCGACHTISEAQTAGVVGPNMDELKPTIDQVTAAVTNGVGAMPAYRDKLTAEQIKDIATYILEATR